MDVYSQMDETANLQSYFIDLKNCWELILIMTVVVFVTTIFYIFILRWIAKPLLYTSMLLLLVCGILLGAWSWFKKDQFPSDSNNYMYAQYGAILAWTVSGLYLIFVLCQWRNISLGASILESASDFLSSNTRVVWLPIITYLLCLPIFAWWTYSSVFLMSMGEPFQEKDSFVASMKYEEYVKYLWWGFLFGFFWLTAFLIAIQQFAIGASTCMWYFSGAGSDDNSSAGDVSVNLGIRWAITYHMGSLAWGSFLIAVITLIKVIFEYLAKKYESMAGKDGAIYKAVTCCLRCVIWCIDAYIKFVNKNAYIQIALHNSHFCKAMQESFYLMVRHAGRFSSAGIIGWIITALGKGALIAGNAYIAILLCREYYPEITQPFIPAFIVALIAYLVSSLFLTIYDFSSLAILHCFLMDEDFGGSEKTPKSLTKFLEINDEMANVDIKPQRKKTETEATNVNQME